MFCQRGLWRWRCCSCVFGFHTVKRVFSIPFIIASIIHVATAATHSMSAEVSNGHKQCPRMASQGQRRCDRFGFWIQILSRWKDQVNETAFRFHPRRCPPRCWATLLLGMRKVGVIAVQVLYNPRFRSRNCVVRLGAWESRVRFKRIQGHATHDLDLVSFAYHLTQFFQVNVANGARLTLCSTSGRIESESGSGFGSAPPAVHTAGSWTCEPGGIFTFAVGFRIQKIDWILNKCGFAASNYDIL
mmetsp:Transcript_4359/g.7780  ORF Transcript_4359/g.7780 Transcript_4359/m.7780 type:complete len:244 (-) Transcript_4359:557-1288(-)